MKTALICGVTGQDGAYLARLLLDRDYQVLGTTRSLLSADRSGLRQLGADQGLELVELDCTLAQEVQALLAARKPTEVYHLAGQSSVGLSFEQPWETVHGIVAGTLNWLEALRTILPSARLCAAGSGEVFDERDYVPAQEETPFQPQSPYAVAKAAAQMLVRTYRESYGLYAVTAVLFNHESPLRPTRFVTRKIAAAAARIATGSQERLKLTRVDVHRDWGWAGDHVEGMWRMLQQDRPRDLILATGRTHSLADFVAAAFRTCGLDWRHHVDLEPGEARPGDPVWSGADPSAAAAVLGWRATVAMPEVARRLVEAELARTNELDTA